MLVKMTRPFRVAAPPEPLTRKMPIVASLIAVPALAWTLFGPAGLIGAVTADGDLDKGWFALGLMVFQGPCAALNLVLLLTTLSIPRRSRNWIVASCLITVVFEGALLWIDYRLPPGSGC